MSDENQHTDVVENPHTEEVVSESVDPPSSGDETTGSTDEHLDFDTLLPKAGQTDPNNRRGGLSRREAARQKEEQGSEFEEDALLTKALEEIEELKTKVSKQDQATARKQAESSFTKALEQAGVSAKEFNSDYKQDYTEEFNDFVELGLSPERAAQKALKQVLPAVRAADAEKRAEGRARATLPPQGKPTSKTVYKHSEVMKIAKTDMKKYKEIMNGRDKGTIQVIE